MLRATFYLAITASIFFIFADKRNTNSTLYQPIYNAKTGSVYSPVTLHKDSFTGPKKTISFSKDPALQGNALLFPADIKYGEIGSPNAGLPDDPADNLFHINITTPITEKDEILLCYEISGTGLTNAVFRSINNGHARVSGWLSGDSCITQRTEVLSGYQFVQGDNVVRFSVADNKNYFYKIRNLNIRINKNAFSTEPLIINTESVCINDSSAFFTGLFNSPDKNYSNISIRCNGIKSFTENGEFQMTVPKTAALSSSGLLVSVFSKDKKIADKLVKFDVLKPTADNIPLQQNIAYNSIAALPGRAYEFKLSPEKPAALSLPKNALTKNTIVSITALDNVDMMPVDEDIVNVTRGAKGYRFLPHGTRFRKNVLVTVPYDTTLIPEGYTASDIRTFFFDEKKREWVMLELDRVQEIKVVVSSRTTHFTDMIAGIIKVPESPQTQGYTPTTIKDIKAANPSLNIDFIEPPTANNMGNAALSYKLKLPGGRHGMQPNLVVTYNNEGGNGWMGIGWNIAVPSIGIETRWGSPRYDPLQETETYTLGGEQLAPLANRDVFIARTPDKKFHPRIEGSFQRIIRYGTNPTNYWWEVTDKEGIKNCYGGTPSTGVITGAVLKDINGNIGNWALAQTIDLNGNTVNYSYALINDPGITGGTVAGQQLYISQVNYTGYNAAAGPYTIDFIRDRQLGEPKRIDVDISGRLGFKMVTADLLRQIKVKFNGQPVRSYEFTYTTGAFFKTLLKSVSEIDAAGDLFYTHQFGYYNDVQTGAGYVPFKPAENWSPAGDQVHGDIRHIIPGFGNESSALSTAKSKNSGSNFAVTLGIYNGLLDKSLTVGGSKGSGSGATEGLVSLIDINGDGLPDKVFKQNGQLWYRSNLGESITGFGNKRPVIGINNFSIGNTKSSSTGFEVNIGIGFYGYTNNNSTTNTSYYFSDFNGDGLIDICNNGTVYFNRLNAAGDPVFLPSSSLTPNPITAGNNVSPQFLTPDTSLQSQNEINFPLQDVIRFWEAPFNGTVSITAPVQLVNTGTGSLKKDGIRASIQTNGSAFWAQVITANDFAVYTPTGVSAIAVTKGQRIYFRLQSRFNGEEDLVNWNPVIQYTSTVTPAVDANGRSASQYKASEDFVLHYASYYKLNKDGVIKIDGNFIKAVTSDTVNIIILKKTSGIPVTVFQQAFACSTIVNMPIVLAALPVLANDEISFILQSDSYIDRTAVNWQPHYEYTSFADATPVLDIDNKPIAEAYVIPNNDNYNNWKIATPVLTNNISDTVYIKPVLSAPASVNGSVTFTVKKINQVVGKIKLQLSGGVIAGPVDSIKVIRNANEKLYCEYNAGDSAMTFTNVLYERIKDSSYIDLLGNPAVITVRQTLPAGLFIQPQQNYMGSLFRGWGHFSFKGIKNDTAPLDENKLNTSGYGGYSFDPNMYADTSLFNLINSISNADFVPLYPDAKKQVWAGYDSSVFISGATQSCSRFLLHDIIEDSLMTGGNVKVVNKVTKTVTKSYSLGLAGSLGIFGGSASRSSSKSNTSNLLDMQDLNGDRHPDVLSNNKIQYTLPTGGLENIAVTHNLGTSTYEGKSKGYSLGGSANIPNSFAKNTTSNNADNASAQSSSSCGITVSGGVNIGENDDASLSGWIDINGDGLPDKVYSNGNVSLNLGYGFTAPENWGITGIETNNTEEKGINASLGISLGFNFVNGSFQGGGALQQTSGKGTASFNDVNGDGLIDKLFIDNSGTLKVQLNTGNGFALPLSWNGLNDTRKNSSVGESSSFAFTIGFVIPIPFLPLKICFNPSWSDSKGLSRENFQVSDIDGDGFADILQSSNDSNLVVNRSTIGRTNMLRTVQRPMGSSFVIDYERMGNTYNLPQSKWVLKNVEIVDGTPGDGVDTMRQTFSYSNGNYDRREREFFGFETVTVNQLNTAAANTVYRSNITQYLNNSYYTKGLQQTTWLQNASGNRFTQNNNLFELRFVADSVYFPALIRTGKLFYEGAATAGVTTYTLMDYDALGNVIKITDAGDGTIDDMQSAVVTYHNNDPLYIKSIPASITVTTTNGVQRQRSTTIDAKANITSISQQIDAATQAVHDMQYDAFGNLQKITRPVNYKGQRMWYQYNYDGATNTYVTKVTDAFGYSSSSTYDLRFGQLLSTLSMNNEPIRYQLDNKGRLTAVTGPYEIAAGKPYTIAFEYFPQAAVPYAISHHYDPEYNADINTVTFMDGMGRAIQVKKQVSLFTGKGLADNVAMTVSGRTFFDAFGRAVKNLYPVTEPLGAGNILFNTSNGNLLSQSTYDVLDRTLTTRLADNAVTTNTYTLLNGFFSTVVKDPLGNTRRTLTDVKERTRQTDLLGGPAGTISTKFQYNALSELLRVLDAANNPTDYTYDNLGRKLTVKHPDAGLTEMKYDPAGNVTQKITAEIRKEIPNGGAINYSYDYERLSDIDYPRQYQNHVTYKYGAANTGSKTGRLILQEDASGGEEFFYGKLGEVVKNIRTVMVNSVFYTTYISEQEYDTWNRIKKMTYADSEVVKYHYNRGGSLNSMDGAKKGNSYNYVQQLGYDEYEQRVYMLYGNGTENSYHYDSLRRRLTALQASTATSRLFINNTYVYDLVSNVRAIVNNTHFTPGELGGYARHNYYYDNLYRLTSAAGSYRATLDTTWYSLSVSYDNLYNITSKNMDRRDLEDTYHQDYTYSIAHPHEPMKIGLDNFIYDANGNQLTYNTRQNFWDEENRLMANVTAGTLSRYTYDAQGERVIKSSGPLKGNWVNGAPAGIVNHDINYTVYVSPYLVCRRTGFTKHYYIEGQRIATKVGTGRFTNISFPQAALTAGGIDYLRRQALLEKQRYAYYDTLKVSPGPPIDKYYYAQPYNSGIAAPVLIDSSNSTIPPGWPGYPGNTTTPPSGPPIFVSPIPSNDSVHAGYGFAGTGAFFEQQQYFYHPDHLGSTNYITNILGQVCQHQEYSAFGESFVDEHSSGVEQPYLYNAKELDAETGLYYYGARYYNPRLSIWASVDPMTEKYPDLSPYIYCANNPIKYIDPDGKDWVEDDYTSLDKIKKFIGMEVGEKSVSWHDDINSQADLGNGSSDKWLGQNVVVATHNRDDNFNEPLNTARFDVYTENNKEGSSATFYGNTVPSNVSKSGVLSPGLYSANSGHRSKPKYANETALLIGGGKLLPSEKDNPMQGYRKEMDGIFLHSGNPTRFSLTDLKGHPFSEGCQTTGSGPPTSINGGASNHKIFSNAVGNNFHGNYYLRGPK